MPIRLRVALFGAGVVMLAMVGFGLLVNALVSNNNPDPTQVAGMRGFLILSGIVILVVALFASWLAAGQALRPLDTVARLMEEIGFTHDLSRRLPTSATHDDVGRLTEAFNRMLQQLERTNQQLASALEAQRRLVADSSHELRTPLTTVRANAGLLLQRDDLTVEDREAALRDIASESERMGRLVGDLLTLARADAGQRLHHEVLDLAQLVRDVAAQAARVYDDRVVVPHCEPCRVRGDAEAIKQLLWVLLHNAAKFTNTGGRIEVDVAAREGRVMLSVADDGIGIPEHELERIFERFYRVDAARSGDGAGLGLSIARWIAEQHSGEIVAANRPNGGAVFTVRLPVAVGGFLTTS